MAILLCEIQNFMARFHDCKYGILATFPFHKMSMLMISKNGKDNNR